MSLRTSVRSLYRGETRFDFIGHRRRWYFLSLAIIVLSLLSFAFRGFNVGVDFKGGTQYQIAVANTSVTTKEVTDAFTAANATPADAAQEVGSGSTRQIVVKFGTQSQDKTKQVIADVGPRLHLATSDFSVDSVSSTWGTDITKKAIEGLIIFLIVVSAYISIRFQWRMALGAIVALLHDLIVAAGIYSIVGFEVTPSTVVGLLTILGFSLYDTVVVYDKVAENAKDLTAGSRSTYSDAANLAVNQTLMRSINTSLIALLPVGGLLFVGALILGVGTIKDLALILFVGLASGAYSSLFLATPVVCELTERDPAYRALAKRVAVKRASERATAGKLAADTELVGAATRPASTRRGSGAAPAPKPGARPQQRPRRR